MKKRLLLVGCGKMGSALLEGWKQMKEMDITVLDPASSDHVQSPQQIKEKIFDIIILAVKPQLMDEVCSELKTAGILSSLYISIAAGKSLNYFENVLGHSQAIIRTMPNTPAMIGAGITAASPNGNVTSDQIVTAESLLSALGKFEWISDEKMMDAVTAVSGSGPAYLFLLIEALAKAGLSSGLPEDLAMKLARQTIIGSALLVQASPEIPASVLRQNVTSPNGTTEAALKILMDENGLEKLMAEAVAVATARSRELS